MSCVRNRNLDRVVPLYWKFEPRQAKNLKALALPIGCLVSCRLICGLHHFRSQIGALNIVKRLQLIIQFFRTFITWLWINEFNLLLNDCLLDCELAIFKCPRSDLVLGLPGLQDCCRLKGCLIGILFKFEVDVVEDHHWLRQNVETLTGQRDYICTEWLD